MDPNFRRPIRRAERLLESDVPDDPFLLFEVWLREAIQADLYEPYAMTLATVGPDGAPSARIVLLRGFDRAGFTFFTSYEGRKAQELAVNPQAALVLFWPEMERQIRIEGRAERTSEAESDAYFASRPVESRWAAWAARQSSVLPDRATLEAAWEAVKARYPDGNVPRPPNWGGYRVVPRTIEFWQAGPHRLHDRFRFTRIDTGWLRERLAP
ncbi:MAG: pyridoxamine 5'-phosphate oxidase [Gemmatales bacterium]|nr:pyridoxamine 5'-phosphate oxidase [Gemmatales bacterium]MDW8385943.1 pyridoxamine 5'-phosphate oxidase [Gemmatales bacterium]